jgi:putative transposase
MANSFTQLHIHYVFIAAGRADIFSPEMKKRIYPYLIGIAKENNCFVHAINGGTDHIHILLKLHPDKSVANIAQLLKGNVSRFINNEKLYPFRFEWQAGYGAFSVSLSNLNAVKQYIDNQEAHHNTTTLKDEFTTLLQKHDISFEDKYLPEM